ncbi:MAG TPA: SDR family oxidoreductase [Actinomycetota bacterium]|nr:SDR family oxidoreductase [Actinomycetota bacterium]
MGQEDEGGQAAMSRVALITGANKGLGRETARRLGALGMTVIVGARDEGRGTAAAAGLREGGADAHYLALDVTDEASVTQAAARVEEQFGRLDVLVNNAGIALERWGSMPSGLSVDKLRRTFETNVLGVLRVTNAFLPLLRRSPAGRIVNVSSPAGSTGMWADPGSILRRYVPPVTGYDLSKAALNALTVHYAVELAGTPIKVNSAAPGYVATDLNNNQGMMKLSDQGSVAAIVQLATLPDDGPSGVFLSTEGTVAW